MIRGKIGDYVCRGIILLIIVFIGGCTKSLENLTPPLPFPLDSELVEIQGEITLSDQHMTPQSAGTVLFETQSSSECEGEVVLSRVTANGDEEITGEKAKVIDCKYSLKAESKQTYIVSYLSKCGRRFCKIFSYSR